QPAEVVSPPEQEDRLACFRELPKDPPIRARYRRVPVSIVLQSLIERLHEQHPDIHIFVADDLKVKEIKESETQTAPPRGLPGPVPRIGIEGLPREERTVSPDFLGESFRDALLTVVYTHALECVKTGDVYRIRPIDQLKKEIDARRELELASRT